MNFVLKARSTRSDKLPIVVNFKLLNSRSFLVDQTEAHSLTKRLSEKISEKVLNSLSLLDWPSTLPRNEDTKHGVMAAVAVILYLPHLLQIVQPTQAQCLRLSLSLFYRSSSKNTFKSRFLFPFISSTRRSRVVNLLCLLYLFLLNVDLQQPLALQWHSTSNWVNKNSRLEKR